MHLREFDNSFNWDESLEKKINLLSAYFFDQLLYSKRLKTSIHENIEQLKGRDLSKAIFDTGNFIGINIRLQDTIDSFMSKNSQEQFSELSLLHSVIGDTIDNLYNLLRMLKRQNIKKNIETSQFAIDSSAHSVNSLETVLNGR